MKLGVHIIGFDLPDPDRGAVASELAAAAAENAGLGWLSAMDHYFQMPDMGGPEHPMLECYATLSYLAARTATRVCWPRSSPPWTCSRVGGPPRARRRVVRVGAWRPWCPVSTHS